MSVPADVVAALRSRGETVATAESLTGGLVCAALTEVPGSSAAVRGGVVAYAVDVKRALLQVPDAVLDAEGAVSRACAEAMAVGGARRVGADWCVATTGVAGPDPSEGMPVGTVHVAVAHGEQAVAHTALHLSGDRETIRRDTVRAALHLLRDTLDTRLSQGRGTVETCSTTGGGPNDETEEG